MDARHERIRDYYAEAMCNYGEYDPEELLDEAVLYDHPLAPYTNGDSEMIVASCYKSIQAFDAAKLDELLWRYPLALYTKGESEFGPTPTLLHEAAHRGAVGCARLLLERGADKDAKDRVGNTPLHLAVARANETKGTSYNSNHVAVIEVLLEKGADKDAVNDMWLTPRDLTKDPAILKLLRYWPPPIASRRSRRTPESTTPQQKRSASSPTPSELQRHEKEAHERLLREEEEGLYVDGHDAAVAASSAAHDVPPSMRPSSVPPSMRSTRTARSARDGSVRSARSTREQIDKGMGQLVKLQKTQVFVTAITAFLFLFRQAASGGGGGGR